MVIFAAVLFLFTVYAAYQLGKYESEHGREDK
jgi:hypothetical protein